MKEMGARIVEAYPSVRWEFCKIERCSSQVSPVAPMPTQSGHKPLAPSPAPSPIKASVPPSIVPELTCATGDGSSYRGTVAVTESGKTCQTWASQYPHEHSRTPEKFPCRGLEKNYCRNPDNERRLWCYTTDPETRWEYCAIPSCDTDCYEGDGSSYRGGMSETISGKKCQNWASMEPHSHSNTPQKVPKADLQENLCRNPDGERAPWCYTTDPSVRWEFCKIERCTSVPPSIVPELTCATGDGSSYRGTVAVTESGKTCQTWASQYPHEHSRTPEKFPCRGLEKNYCRNPDNERRLWCYTTDPETRWEYCAIPSCDTAPHTEQVIAPTEDCYEGDGSSYRGGMSETISGKKCQNWASMEPHSHSNTPQKVPKADLQENLCRNPDGERAPWCYTTDPSVRWEFCKIERCSSQVSPV
ncbi:plasminogen-like, partial [Brachyhypopomus gauderio]|uniref:plasminogen-like n=1 Tax=Brachyhypopomus gauderio TaxID=698409 RepID=UPI0040422EF5